MSPLAALCLAAKIDKDGLLDIQYRSIYHTVEDLS